MSKQRKAETAEGMVMKRLNRKERTVPVGVGVRGAIDSQLRFRMDVAIDLAQRVLDLEARLREEEESHAKTAKQLVDMKAFADFTEARLREAEKERDLAIAHDRQPYPTAFAYEAVCKALEGTKDALKRAKQFIENGVEFGYITLPEKGDPALDTLPKIKEALSILLTGKVEDFWHDCFAKGERGANYCQFDGTHVCTVCQLADARRNM